MTHMQILKNNRQAILALADQYGIYDVRVFGSVARGDETDQSDIDLLVKVRPGYSLFDLGGFMYDIRNLLNLEVDVVTDKGLRTRIRDQVLREAIAI